MITLDVHGKRVTVAPLLQSDDTVRTLPDPRAAVHVEADGLTATWPDGVVLELATLASEPGWSLRTTLRGTTPNPIRSLGFRLIDVDADRLLVDGYHSGDWAGLRSLSTPGAGWWGAILGTAGQPPLAIHLNGPPRAGALHLTWRGDGSLDITTTGEPGQETMRTGAATQLAPGLVRSDWVRIGPLTGSGVAGAGMPPLPTGAHPPGRRRTGWMSWNCLGSSVSAADVVDAAHFAPPGGVVLLDDGWMPRWGDWVERPGFDSTLPDLADAVANQGRSLGLWLAPFQVDPESRIAAMHPEWLLGDPQGDGHFGDHRPGTLRHALDASRADVRHHLRGVGERLGRAGIGALKLDFLYAGASPARRAGAPGSTGVHAIREGMRALIDGYRTAAPPDSAVWASLAPMPPLVGLFDAARSGGDAVISIPTANTPPPMPPHFVHGTPILNAQRRNLAARSWLWGATVPPDIDAVTLGKVGGTPPVDDTTATAWLRLAVDSGGPLLVSDTDITPERFRMLGEAQAIVADSPPQPVPTIDPLSGDPAPPEDDDFLSQPGVIAEWQR